MTYTVHLCGGDAAPGPRDTCPNTLHDWPLPAGYLDAHQEAHSRLSRRWASTRCPQCGLYGWRPGKITTETHVPAPQEGPPVH